MGGVYVVVFVLLLLLIMAVLIFFSKKRRPKSDEPKEQTVSGHLSDVPHYSQIISDRSKKRFIYPNQVDGAALRYYYDLPLSLTKDSFDPPREECLVNVQSAGNEIIVSLNGEDIGVVYDENKAKMLKDWEKRGDPANAVLKQGASQINLRFYRDLKKYLGNRESTVTGLIKYKGASKQETLSCACEGVELGIQEDGIVTLDSEEIGQLPTRIAKRFTDEGAFAAYLVKIETELNEDGDETYIPTIKLYW